MIFEALTVMLLGMQATSPEFRHNSLYAFNIDNDGTVVVQNTQTGELYRCSREFECDGIDLKPKKKD
jgi:DNA repair exonuclease SbcCD ATPase subunit